MAIRTQFQPLPATRQHHQDFHRPTRTMDGVKFQRCGKEMIDYICQYLDTIRTRPVTPAVEQGYLKNLLPNEAPYEPDSWESIMKDIESKIMPGVTHWQHPDFYAFFPSGNSFPAILADMLSDAIGCVGFSWPSSPACTELEIIVVDWLGRAIGLPEALLASGKGSIGGGVIQSSASDCILAAMLAARYRAIRYLTGGDKKADDRTFLPLLVAYTSQEAHSCVEKAAMISLVKLRILETDENNSLRGETLRKAIEEDKKNGLVPFFVSATLGTTSCCSFDNLVEIGPICKQEETIWMHVDGAYAGNSFICPENKPLMAGIEYADSFNTNTNKWLLVAYDCSAMWVRDKDNYTKAFVVNPIYLQHDKGVIIDYRHWGIPLSRRFRSLKLWFVLRIYGIKGLQNYIRNHCRLAKVFESLVLKDDRFEIMNNVKLGLVCFRLREPKSNMTHKFLDYINDSQKLFLTPAKIKDNEIIRFCVNYQHASEADIEHAWAVIQDKATEFITMDKNLIAVQLRSQRKLSNRFSFIKRVTREEYNASCTQLSLRDGSTPLLVPDDE